MSKAKDEYYAFLEVLKNLESPTEELQTYVKELEQQNKDKDNFIEQLLILNKDSEAQRLELEQQKAELIEALKSSLNWVKEGMTETNFIIGFNDEINLLNNLQKEN